VILDESLDIFRFAHLAVGEYLETQLSKVESHTEIAKVCLSLLCAPDSWDDYDTSRITTATNVSDRHLWLYSAVFWPWHFAHCDERTDCRILTYLWDTFLSENCYTRWLRYHRRCVIPQVFHDRFWNRSSAFQYESDDVLSSVCLFGLGGKFPTVFNSMSVENAGIDQPVALRLKRKHSAVSMPQPVEKAQIDRLLLQACRLGDLDITRLLIGVGADITAANKDQQMALHLAAGEGHEAVVRLLLDRGADPSAIGIYGRTPLHQAANGGHEAVTRLLINRSDISACDAHRLTPLHLASKRGHEVVARLLIDWGADVSAIASFYGWTPLHLALDSMEQAVARLLVERGADVSAIDLDRQTPLHFACRRGYETVARLLVDLGADVSAVDERYERTPLHLASETGNEALVRLLADRGADISVADKTGCTPLHLAEKRGLEEVARFLRNCWAPANVLTAAPAVPSSL
jgi:ankyrin repeat protein